MIVVARGTLRIYLGAAPGVGKTFAMLNEGRRRATAGTDVVVGLRRDPRRAAPPSRSATSRSCPPPDRVPRHDVRGDGRRRGPRPRRRRSRSSTSSRTPTCPGRATRSGGRTSTSCSTPASTSSRRSTSSTSSRSTTSSSGITGVKQRETIPDEIVRAADQVELVDMTPRRSAGGWPTATSTRPRRSTPPSANYFRPATSAPAGAGALWVADRSTSALEEYCETPRHRRAVGDPRAGRRRRHRRARRTSR